MTAKEWLSRKVAVAGMVLAASLVTVAASTVTFATEGDKPTLYWLDDREELTYGPPLPDEIMVQLGVEGTLTGTMTITLSAINFTSEDGQVLDASRFFSPTMPVTASVSERSKSIVIGTKTDLNRSPDPEVQCGSYTGQLLAQLDTGEPLAQAGQKQPIRKKLTLVVPCLSSLGGLVPETEALTIGRSIGGLPLSLVNAWGALLDRVGVRQPEQGTSIEELVSLRLYDTGRHGQDLSGVHPVTATLSTENGQTVIATLSPTSQSRSTAQVMATLGLMELSAPGKYTGSMQLVPMEPGEGTSLDITAVIRDDWKWPLAVLVMGLLISNWLSWVAGFSRPFRRLRIDLSRLKEEAIGLQQAEEEQGHPLGWPVDEGVYRIYDKGVETDREAGEESGLLTSATEQALGAFRDAQSPDERTKWGPGGEEFRRIREYVRQLPGLYALSRTTFEHYARLKEQVEEHDKDVDFSGLPVAETVHKALKPRLVNEAQDLVKLQEDLKEASSFVDDFRDLYLWLLELERMTDPQSTPGGKVRDLHRQLTTPRITNADWVRQIRAETERWAREIAASLEAVTSLTLMIPFGKFSLQDSTLAEAITDAVRLRALRLGELTDPRELIGSLGPVEALSTAVKEGAWGLWWLNFAFDVVSGSIVVLTGLAALYIGNSSFGSLGDYATVFLWGTVVDEGFKLARRLGPGLVGQLLGR